MKLIHEHFDLVFGYLEFFLKKIIGCLWIAPLTPAVIVMRGLICQSIVLSVCTSRLYLIFFRYVQVFEKNL